MSSGYDPVLAALESRHAASRTATNELHRRGRPLNTVRQYDAGAAEFRAFCERSYAELPPESRYTVTADKLHEFVKLDLFVRQKKKGKEGKLSTATIEARISGVIDLWAIQRESGINSFGHPAPQGGHVRKLMQLRQSQEAQRRRVDFVDRGLGTHLEAFSITDLLACNVASLGPRYIQDAGNALRDRLALNLSFSCLLRGQTARNAELCDFHYTNLPNEGTQPATALCLSIDIDKTQQTGKKMSMGAMRSKDYRLCSQGALAMYLFHRRQVVGEPFPDLSNPKKWYNIKLLATRETVGEGCLKAMGYNTHLASVNALFKAASIKSLSLIHI